MAQKLDLDAHAPGTALSPGQRPLHDARPSPKNDATSPLPREPAPISHDTDHPALRIDRTVEIPGAKTPREAETAAAPPSPSPTSSERLAQLAAHLPRVERDTYTAGSIVAKGGIGRVRRARDQRLDRPVALKELLVWNEGQEQRFLHEALLTARLQHPAIVPIYEAGRWPDGEPFYAMKLVSGRSLADLIGQKKRLEDRLSLLPHVLTVAQAIAYAHSQRILHRDLKPANVLVGEFGETVVIDWGLAKGLGEKDGSTSGDRPIMTGEGLTIEGAVVGTPAYMPPEQAAGDPVDERADIYAIGAMLYHLAAAVPPYHDTPWEKLLQAIAEGPPRPVEKLAPALSDDLCAIVHKAMARDPARRYQAAKDLADDLDRFLTGQIVAAHSYSTSQLLRRFWRRNRTVLSISIAATVALALVIAYAFVETDRERRFALEKQRDAEIAEQNAHAAQQSAESAGRQAISRADDLTLLQAQGALDRDPNEALAWLKTLSPSFTDAAELRRIAADAHARGISRAYRGHTAHINFVYPLGATGQFITSSDDKTLRLWDARTGESRVFSGHTDEAWGLAVSPDKTRVASTSQDSTVRVWDLATGKQVARADLPEPARKILYRDDGVLFGTPGSGAGTPWAWDPGAPDVRFLIDRSLSIQCSAISQNGLAMAVLRKDGDLVFTDLVTGKQRTLGKFGGAQPHLVLSHDGGLVVASRESDAGPAPVTLWKTDTGESVEVPLTKKANELFLSKKSDLLISAGAGGVEVYDIAAKKIAKSFPGHGYRIYTAYLSEDATRLVTGGYDRTVRTIDLATGETRAFSGLRGVVSDVSFWPDANGKSVIAASSGGDVRLFEPARAGTILTDHHASSGGLVVSADGRVASVDEKGLLRITDLEGKVVADHALGPSPGIRLVRSPDGLRFAGGTIHDPKIPFYPAQKTAAPSSGDASPNKDDVVVIGTFDSAKPTVVKVGAGVRSVRFSPTSEAVFATLDNGTIQRIDGTGTLTEIDRSGGFTGALAISPDGKQLAAGCTDGTVRLTDLAALSHRDLTRHKEAVSSLAFSRDGVFLATGSFDHTIHVLRLSDGTERRIEAGGGGVRRMEFSPDAKTLYFFNLVEAIVRRWSVDAGAPQPSLTGHGGGVTGFTLSSDGRRVVTYSEDKTARLCDVASAKCRTLAGHEAPILHAAFAPGDRLLLTLDQSGVVRAWPDDLPESLPELRAWLEAATTDRIEGTPDTR